MGIDKNINFDKYLYTILLKITNIILKLKQ